MTSLRYKWVAKDNESLTRAVRRGWTEVPRAEWPAELEMPVGADDTVEAFWLYSKPEQTAAAEDARRTALNRALADQNVQHVAAILRAGLPETMLNEDARKLVPMAKQVNAWMDGTWNNSPTETSTT